MLSFLWQCIFRPARVRCARYLVVPPLDLSRAVPYTVDPALDACPARAGVAPQLLTERRLKTAAATTYRGVRSVRDRVFDRLDLFTLPD